MDALGLSTPGMRNRRAQRRARHQSRMWSRNNNNVNNVATMVSADVPFPFNMCGVGLLFGDGTLEDEAVVDTLEKRRTDRAKVRYEREDAEKRRFRMRKKESRHLEEGIEVVESFDKGEEEEEEAAAADEKNERSRTKSSLRDKMSKSGRNIKSSMRSPPGSPNSRGSDPPEDIPPGGGAVTGEGVPGRSRVSMKNRGKSKKLIGEGEE